MKKRTLGRSAALEVSEIGLGCMGMSEFYGQGSEAESISVIHRAIDLGITFFDTADIYGVGRNEQLVGKALRDHRKQVILATKFGNVRDEQGNFKGISGKLDYVRSCCEASLRRLNTDVIDLYYQHRVDPDTPIEDTVGAMADLIREGKVRFLGLSEAGPDTIRRAHTTHPITALQTEYSLWSRDPETDVLPITRELGIGFVPYSPLGRGFLTGQIKSVNDLAPDDWRRNNPRFQGDNFQRNLKLVDEICVIAREKNCEPSQLALAWVLAQGNDMAPIPGTKHTRYLEENVGATDISLTAKELERIDRVIPHGAAAGTRYTEAGMRAVGR